MDIPKTVIQAFEALGDAQRGAPESAMLAVQRAMGGGVLSPVVENVGDLTHRMTHMAGWHFDDAGCLGYGYVIPKVESSLRYLKHPYGFEREMRENVVSNAKYRNESPSELLKKIDQTLLRYAEEHAKLAVYNIAQARARDAAIALGRRDFPRAIRNLEALAGYLKTPERWVKEAGDYALDAHGNPKPVIEKNGAYYRRETARPRKRAPSPQLLSSRPSSPLPKAGKDSSSS